MKRLLLLAIVILVCTGCNRALTITKIEIEKVNGKLEDLIEEIGAENGSYLITGEKEQYVYLNRTSVIQGEVATGFSEFETNVSENVLYLSYKEEIAKDSDSKELQHQLLYRIKGGKDDYDTIDLIGNGESTCFDTTYVW